MKAALRSPRLTFRGCREIGSGTRVFGCCLGSCGHGIHIRRAAPGQAPYELTTHDGSRLEIGDRVFVNYAPSILLTGGVPARVLLRLPSYVMANQ